MIGATPKIEALMLAISEHEGWHPPQARKNNSGSRAYRHHNPGNLRKSPFECDNIDRFSVFRSDMIGFMALHWDLMQKARGNTVTNLNKNSTIRDLIYVYAPPSDNNDTEAYIKNVTQKMGVPDTYTLGEIFDIK